MIRLRCFFFRGKMFQERISNRKIFSKKYFSRLVFYGILHVNTRCRQKEVEKKGRFRFLKQIDSWLNFFLALASIHQAADACRCSSRLYQPNASKKKWIEILLKTNTRGSRLRENKNFLFLRMIFFILVDEWMLYWWAWRKCKLFSQKFVRKGQTAKSI